LIFNQGSSCPAAGASISRQPPIRVHVASFGFSLARSHRFSRRSARLLPHPAWHHPSCFSIHVRASPGSVRSPAHSSIHSLLAPLKPHTGHKHPMPAPVQQNTSDTLLANLLIVPSSHRPLGWHPKPEQPVPTGAILPQFGRGRVGTGYLKKHLEEFQAKKGFPITFETIGKDFYIKFTDYLQDLHLKPNTIGSHIKRLKRLMNEALEDNLTSNQNHHKRDFKVIKEDVDTVYLTENEIKALYEMPLEIDSKRKIRDIFVLMCYTGLRHSDWSKVSSDNIHDGKLYVRTQKTNEPIIIPIKPLVSEILERYGTIQVPTLQKTNDAIRWIGEKAYDNKLGTVNLKKWLQIRTHTVRRSFATNAYLAGIPMHDIMQITGHRTTASFLRYIRVTKLETAEKLKDHPFFS